MKKFELSKETMSINGVVLHRIRALRDFSNVKRGYLGGWVEKEANLSHGGNSWIYGDATVYGNALVSEDAIVCERASVFDNARVSEKAKISYIARVCGNAWVKGNAVVDDDAAVFGNAVLSGDIYLRSGHCFGAVMKSEKVVQAENEEMILFIVKR